MNFLKLFVRSETDEGVKEFHETPDAVLLDVRTSQEYAEGFIPDSVNLPLNELSKIAQIVPDQDTPLFVYCRSGARSGQAVSYLKQAGYRFVKNIGGIADYHGKVERG